MLFGLTLNFVSVGGIRVSQTYLLFKLRAGFDAPWRPGHSCLTKISYYFSYELALMRRGARALCYWDSSCDFSLPGNGQLRTSTFSNRMFGNLDGVVFTGPFRNWPIPGQGNLRRGMQPPGNIVVLVVM